MCGNRAQRPGLQWRLSRLGRGFGFGSFGSQTVPVWNVFISRARRTGYLVTHSPWVADPGRGAERLTERYFGMGLDAEKRNRSRVLRDVA